MVTTNENALKKSKETLELIWILIDHDCYPSTVLGVYPSYEQAEADVAYEDPDPNPEGPGQQIVCWDIINNMEVNYTGNDEETT